MSGPATTHGSAGPRRDRPDRPGRSTRDRGGPAAGSARPARADLDARRYDPRREERRKAARVELPDEVDPRMLDPDVRRELRSLSKETADLVARHLVTAGRLLDDDPSAALTHARAARAMAGRVGVVREAVGIAAYAAQQWAESLAELRAARRITGDVSHLAVLADCERALGRPDRALALAEDPGVSDLGQPERVELAIVLSGARRDLGQPDAAVLLLEGPARRTRRDRPWAARLWYALADALLDAGRREQAREWFAEAAAADEDGQTDATDRLLELDGMAFEDLDPSPAEDTTAPGRSDPAAGPAD